METILIIAGLIQLVILFTVVSAIVNIKKKVNEISERQLYSFQLRKNAYKFLKIGDKEAAISAMKEALYDDLYDAIDKRVYVNSKVDAIVVDYLIYWSILFPDESDKIVSQIRDEVLSILNK